MREILLALRTAWRLFRRDAWVKSHCHGLHMVPLDEVLDGGFPRAAMSRPTLCGIYITSPGGGTVQPDIVGCWDCALAIERDRHKWYATPRANWTTENDMTTCSTCGGVIGYPPGCTCRKTLKQWWRQWLARRAVNRDIRRFNHE